MLYLIEATRAGTQNLTLLSIPTLDQHSILLANWTLNDIYYNIYDGNLYFSTDDTSMFDACLILIGAVFDTYYFDYQHCTF